MNLWTALWLPTGTGVDPELFFGGGVSFERGRDALQCKLEILWIFLKIINKKTRTLVGGAQSLRPSSGSTHGIDNDK